MSQPENTILISSTSIEMMMTLINEQGINGFGPALQILLNEAMKIERSRYLCAKPYERSSERIDYANGFKDKTLNTRIGAIKVNIPQVRNGDFYPSALEKGQRSEQALKLAVAEMYVQGVSTRKIKAITEQLCGLEISSTEVSRISQKMDVELEKWRTRKLGKYPYLIVDALYEKVRHDGTVISLAVLIAYGINEEGRREVLGVSVSLSEAEVHWRSFFESLIERGLYGVELITSDAHAGLQAARQAVFPTVPWQRCQFHLQQNASSYVTKKDNKEKVAADIRNIFNAPDETEAKRLLALAVTKYASTESKVSAWMEENILQGFAVFKRPKEHQQKVRTSNMAERMNKEIRRRTKVVGIFPNDASCLRLISALLCETHEDWMQGNVYLKKSEKKEE
jgi:putative transposase